MAGPFALLGAGVTASALTALGGWMWNNWKDYNKSKAERAEALKAKKGGALKFLGKDSSAITKYEKPVTDIVAGSSVLGNVTGSLLPSHTIVPEIDTSAILASTFAGIVLEIQRINNNIVAIRDAMIASSIIEAKHRQQVIADLEQAIADRDKASSQDRAETRREDQEEDEETPKPGEIGSVAKAMKEIGIISGVAIFAEFIAALKSGTAGKFFFGDKKTTDMEGGGIVSGPDSGYQVTLHGTEMVIPLDNKATDNILGNEVTQSGSVFANNTNNSSSFSLNNSSNIFGSNSLGSASYFTSGSNTTSLISSNSSFNTLIGDDEGTMTVIDMRTAKNLVGDKKGASVKSANEILTLSPERRMSPYEPFVTNHA